MRGQALLLAGVLMATSLGAAAPEEHKIPVAAHTAAPFWTAVTVRAASSAIGAPIQTAMRRGLGDPPDEAPPPRDRCGAGLPSRSATSAISFAMPG